MGILIFILFAVCLLFEGTLTGIPLVFTFLILYAVWKKNNDVLLLGFIAGVILDIMTIRTVGVTSMFYLLFLFITMLYQRKYEVRSLFFILPIIMIGSMLFLLLFPVPIPLLQVICNTAIAGIGFIIIDEIYKRSQKKEIY